MLIIQIFNLVLIIILNLSINAHHLMNKFISNSLNILIIYKSINKVDNLMILFINHFQQKSFFNNFHSLNFFVKKNKLKKNYYY